MEIKFTTFKDVYLEVLDVKDDDGNQLSSTYSNGKRVKWEYDDNGNNILCVTSKDGEDIYEIHCKYDDKNRLIKHTEIDLSNGKTSGFVVVYNEDGSITEKSFTDPSNFTIKFFNEDNKITKIETHSGKCVDIVEYEYDENGNITKQFLNGTIIRSIEYNDLNKKSKTTFVDAEDPEKSYTEEFFYDDEGRLEKMEDNSNTIIIYKYSPLNTKKFTYINDKISAFEVIFNI